MQTIVLGILSKAEEIVDQNEKEQEKKKSKAINSKKKNKQRRNVTKKKNPTQKEEEEEEELAGGRESDAPHQSAVVVSRSMQKREDMLWRLHLEVEEYVQYRKKVPKRQFYWRLENNSQKSPIELSFWNV